MFEGTNRNPVFDSLLDAEGWADVSHWAALAPQIGWDVDECISTELPLVQMPEAHPVDRARWIILNDPDICPIIDAETVHPD